MRWLYRGGPPWRRGKHQKAILRALRGYGPVLSTAELLRLGNLRRGSNVIEQLHGPCPRRHPLGNPHRDLKGSTVVFRSAGRGVCCLA